MFNCLDRTPAAKFIFIQDNLSFKVIAIIKTTSKQKNTFILST